MNLLEFPIILHLESEYIERVDSTGNYFTHLLKDLTITKIT